MTTVSVVRHQRREKTGDSKSPMMYALKPRPGESKLCSVKSLARETEPIDSLSVEGVEHVVQSFVHSMKKVLVAGSKVKVDGLGIFYTILTCPGMEQEKDCTMRNITRVNLRFKVDGSLQLVNNSTATTRGGDNNIAFELTSKNTPASGGSGDGGGSGSGGDSGGGSGSGGDGGEGKTPDPTI